MLSHALHASFADTANQRVSDRRVLRLEARVATPHGEGGIQVHNLSRSGLLLEGVTDVASGHEIEVELPGGTNRRAEVIWADEALVGCRFAEPLTQAELSAALLRAAPTSAAPTHPRPLTQAEALAKLREHWAEESDGARGDAERKLPLGTRLWLITGLAAAGWALPAAAAALMTL